MNIERAEQRLRAGDLLHKEICEDGQRWWFEGPYAQVPTEVVSRLLAFRALAERRDSLFGSPVGSQTYESRQIALMRQIESLAVLSPLRCFDEKQTQADFARALEDWNFEFKREHRLGPRSIIDFMVEDVGIELKLRGQKRSILRQVQRYCEFKEVAALLLLTGTAMGLPPTIYGKPVRVLSVGRAWL